MADYLIGVQGIRFIYLKKRDRSWIYRLGDDEMKYALLQMTETQLRIIEELIFENKTVTDESSNLRIQETLRHRQGMNCF